jgi:tetratricopeptide (TPR) repeat protein
MNLFTHFAASAWRWYRLESASMLARLKRTDTARTLYQTLLRDHPRDAHVYSCFAFFEVSQGNRSAAYEYLDRALALQPDDARALYNRAFMHQQDGRHVEALAGFDRMLSRHEAHDLALYGKALSLIALGRHAEAIPPLKRNTELQPMSPFGWYQLARVYFDLGKAEATKDIIRHLKGFEPKVADQLIRETGINIEPAQRLAGA